MGRLVERRSRRRSGILLLDLLDVVVIIGAIAQHSMVALAQMMSGQRSIAASSIALVRLIVDPVVGTTIDSNVS